MPFKERKKLKNHFMLDFIPFGGCFEEFIEPSILEIKILEKGKIMNIQGIKSFIIASLGDITADLPQGNDLVRVKWHNAIKDIVHVVQLKIYWHQII